MLAGREELGCGRQPLGELRQDLERGDALSRFDAGEICGRASLEGELPLLEACRQACGANPGTDGGWVVDVRRGTARHVLDYRSGTLHRGKGAGLTPMQIELLRPEAPLGEHRGQHCDNGQDGRQIEHRPHGTVLSVG